MLLDGNSYALVTKLMQELDDDDVWKYRAFDLTAYRGRSVVLYFEVFNDGTSTAGRSWMYLDDVSLKFCQGSLPTATPTVCRASPGRWRSPSPRR